MDLLYLAIVFAVIAIVAGFFGFRTVGGTSMEIAKILFFIFVVLAIIAFFAGRTALNV